MNDANQTASLDSSEDVQPELIYSAKGKPPICSVCCAEAGWQHEDYCHGTGAVVPTAEVSS